jgi:hypothetical protein
MNGDAFDNNGEVANAAALQAVASLINEIQAGGMVQKFVLLVETIDEEDRWMSAFVAPGQKRWDTLGLLDYGLTLERQVLIRLDDDDDDPED